MRLLELCSETQRTNNTKYSTLAPVQLMHSCDAPLWTYHYDTASGQHFNAYSYGRVSHSQKWDRSPSALQPLAVLLTSVHSPLSKTKEEEPGETPEYSKGGPSSHESDCMEWCVV